MKKICTLLVLGTFLSAASYATSLSFFASYWDTDRLDEAFGGGIGVGIPIGPVVELDLRATYLEELTDDPIDGIFDDDEDVFEETSVELLPLDLGLRFNFHRVGVFNPYVGAGGTYYLLDVDGRGADIDDEVGYYGLVGARFGDDDGVGFFTELLYRKVQATVVGDDPDDFDLDNEVSFDLDGFSAQLGLRWNF